MYVYAYVDVCLQIISPAFVGMCEEMACLPFIRCLLLSTVCRARKAKREGKKEREKK